MTERNGFVKSTERKHIEELLERYRLERCSDAERAWLEAAFTSYVRDNEELPTEEEWVRAERLMHDRIIDKVKPRHRFPSIHFSRIAAAAVLLIASVVMIWRISNDQPNSPLTALQDTMDIGPGGERATLTLADGTKIFLDEAVPGQLIADRGIRIHKTDRGEVVYEIDAETAGLPSMNTIQTPRGGQYKVVLPDGTQVWLNAASSLTYPTRFPVSERRVTLTGEAYFDVKKQSHAGNAAVPFVVEAGMQRIEVLGTHFNVSAYGDEVRTKTTLVEGAVRVSDPAGQHSHVLEPGQQCIAEGTDFFVQTVDVESAISWKYNVISFRGSDLWETLRQIERWYDVVFDVQEISGDVRLYGEISRDRNLSDVLEGLSVNTGLHFEPKGRRIAVTR